MFFVVLLIKKIINLQLALSSCNILVHETHNNSGANYIVRE